MLAQVLRHLCHSVCECVRGAAAALKQLKNFQRTKIQFVIYEWDKRNIIRAPATAATELKESVWRTNIASINY